jgi:hypothetical protein
MSLFYAIRSLHLETISSPSLPEYAHTHIHICSEKHRLTRPIQRRTDSYTSPAVVARGSSDDAWTHDLFDRNGDRRAQLANNPLAARLGDMYFPQERQVDE